MTDLDLFHNPDYVHGQLAGLRQLILAVAQTMPKSQFRQVGIERLETARTVLLPRNVPDATLLAIDHLEAWLKHVTGQAPL